MFQTIQSKMVAIFVTFTLLLVASAATTHYVLTQKADDGLIINLAGRQRMLTQRMTKESMQLVNAAAQKDAARIDSSKDGLRATMRVFEATLLALKDGGSAPVNFDMTVMRPTSAPTSESVKKQLESVASMWAPFKKSLELVIQTSGTDETSINSVADSNLKLMGEMDSAVTLMQTDSEKKIQLLYLIQGLSLALGVGLVVLGAWTARSEISKPISDLATAAREMSIGNLNIELHPSGTREVRELGASFDRMRASMLAALGSGLTEAHEDL
jgi:methyl-accepting chemotaxis protein